MKRVLVVGLMAVSALALADDSLPGLDIAAAAAQALHPNCQVSGALPSPLTLVDAVSFALCHNPKAREAWMTELSRRADVDVGHSAYWPTLQGQASIGKATKRIEYPDAAEFNSNLRTQTSSYSLNLNWVLFDFGLREARLENARNLLRAAGSSRLVAVQEVFFKTAQAFYQMQASQALLDAAVEAEQQAADNLRVAEGQHRGGAGLMSDRLQAKTAYADARLERADKASELVIARGELANWMSLPPGTPLTLLALNYAPQVFPEFEHSLERLMADAAALHPKVQAVRAELEAERNRVTEALAQGRPSIALFGSADHSDTPIDQVSSKQTIDSQVIGLQITIPLFEGFLRQRQARSAEYQAKAKEEALQTLQETVALDVWKSYQRLQAHTERLEISQLYVDSARESFSVAQGRYKAGVGGMLELLKAQSDLASARQKQVESMASWYGARLQLAADLGSLE